MEDRSHWISRDEELSIAVQCELLGVPRSSYYYCPRDLSELNIRLMHLIDELYTKHPASGSRVITAMLRNKGFDINRKRTQKLMRMMGIQGLAPGPMTSKSHPEHKKYPYLLSGYKINAPMQVWSTDITYIRLQAGYVYLTAVIDWFSRLILSWRLSNSLEGSFCIEALEEALEHGKPEIFNTDQGVQFTSSLFVEAVTSHGISFSMDGRGRALDNVFIERFWRSLKYEEVYLKDYENVLEARKGLEKYCTFYNHERPHQSLSYRTPFEVHHSPELGTAVTVASS